MNTDFSWTLQIFLLKLARHEIFALRSFKNYLLQKQNLSRNVNGLFAPWRLFLVVEFCDNNSQLNIYKKKHSLIFLPLTFDQSKPIYSIMYVVDKERHGFRIKLYISKNITCFISRGFVQKCNHSYYRINSYNVCI